MDTFIVRFYRRTHEALKELAGTVEHVGSGRRAGFAGEQELLERLLEPDDTGHSEPPRDDGRTGAPDPLRQGPA